MEKTVKMFIETTDGKKLEQDVPEGLIAIYLEKGWKEVKEITFEKPLKAEKTEKTYFNTKKNNK